MFVWGGNIDNHAESSDHDPPMHFSAAGILEMYWDQPVPEA